MIKRARRKACETGMQEKLSMPWMKWPGPQEINVSDNDQCTIQQQIHQFYTLKRAVPGWKKMKLDAGETTDFHC